MKEALDSMLVIAGEFEDYKEKVTKGQRNWSDDEATARKYYKLIS